MATRRAQTGPAQSYAAVITAVGVAGAVAATWFGYPGAVVVWVALVVAGWLEQAPPFTGKKDQRGFPTPAHPGEQKAMNTYRFWADLRWRLVCPTLDWLPGWPVLGSWLGAVGAALLVSFLPIDGQLPGDGGSTLPRAVVFANMAVAFIVVAQVMASRRRTVAEDDQCPGARVNTLPLLVAEKKNAIALAVAVLAVVGVVVYVGVTLVPQRLTLSGPLGQLSPLFFPLVTGLLAAGGVVAHPWQAAALAEWRELVKVRREWAPRWQALKQDPAPFLSGHKQVGVATVDTFDAPPSVGATFFYTQSAKITPTLGANMRVAVLEVPNTDGQGQPVPGTAHPLRFDVVMWPADQIPDVTEPGTDPAVAELLVRCSMAWAADMIGFARFILTGCDLVTTPESPCVWATQWAPTMEIGLSWVRNQANGALANGARTTVLTDHRMLGGAGVVFYGALGNPATEYEASSGITDDAIAWIAEEDEWRGRWAATLKQNVNAPVPQQAVKAQATLADGTVIHHQPFVTLSGEDPAQFMTGLEGKLAATIPGSAPFMSIAWYTVRGTDRSGERHAQAFTVSYADRPVPSLSALAPARSEAPRWVISGHMNDAFTAARLARPEVLAVQCLTTATSREHIWQVSLRLYGGVTLSDVRGAAQRLKTALGTKWLRVAPAEEGCIIFAGGEPAKVKLARPERDTPRLVALDWGQAWLDSKVSGVGGLVPVLAGVDHLPKNEAVQVLDFDLPSGLSVADIKGATEKLKTATGNAFVEVRPGVGGASTVRLLVCEVNPLPDKAPYDFDEVDRSNGIPFATGIDGECIVFNPKADPHLMIAGMSGGGKSVVLQSILYGALIRGWDVYLADPVKGAADFRFAEPYAKAMTVDAFEAAAMMKAAYAEVVRRKNLNSQHGVGNYRDLPEDIRPAHMVVIIDEFTSLMGADPVPKPSDDPTMDHERDLILASNQAKTEIGVYAGKCAREARSAGLTLVLATQKMAAKMLDTIPGAGDLKDLSLDTRLPVPVSDRFPSGWARNGELQIGDVLYSAAGAEVTIAGFSEVFTDNDVYEVTFDDGQTIMAGAEHLWKVSDEASRKKWARAATDMSPRRLDRAAAAERVARSVPVGTYATAGDLAGMLGYANAQRVTELAGSFGLDRMVLVRGGVQALPRDARNVRGVVYEVTEFCSALSGHLRHLAGVRPDGSLPPLERVVSTREMADVTGRVGRLNWAVRTAAAVDGPDADLPLDPYVLGAWLGDGSTGTGIIAAGSAESCTGPDGVSDQAHMIARLDASGFAPRALDCSDRLIGTRGLKAALRCAGVLNAKHIPPAYLRASAAQRLALLQGLMDTDGTLSGSGQCSIGQNNLALARDILELVRSLGIKAHWSEWDARYTPDGHSEAKVTGRVHTVSFKTALPVFRLPRKLARQVAPVDGGRANWRYVTAVRRVAPVPTRCIAVDDPAHLFLVEGFIPTHNTNLSRMLLGKATNGDRMSALRAPFEAPELGDSVPPGRGLWETTEGAAKVMQGWYDPREQGLLSEELATRLQPLPAMGKLDLAPFMAKIPQAGDGEFARITPPAAGPTEPVVVELDELELSLDDLLNLEDDGADAGTGELPEWAAEFAAATAAAGHDLLADPFTHGTEPVWADEADAAAAAADLAVVEPAEVVTDEEEVAVFLDVDGVLAPAPAEWGDVTVVPAGARGSAAVSPTVLRLLGRLPGHLVWATAWGSDADATFAPLLGRSGELVGDADGSVHGWWKLDAVVAWLAAHPAVKTVVWVDDELSAVDDLDIEHRETAWDVLSDAGVECLLLAPTGDGLAREEMAEVHEFLDVVPDEPAPVPVVVVPTQSTAPDPILDAIPTLALPEVDDSRTFSPDKTDIRDGSSTVGADGDTPPAPRRVTAGLLAPVPDEW